MIRPLGNTVVVQRDTLPDRTRGGLWLLGREWPARGRVLAVGPGRRTRRGTRVPIDLEPGDEVAFDKWSVETRLVPGTEDIFIIDADRCFLRLRTITSVDDTPVQMTEQDFLDMKETLK